MNAKMLYECETDSAISDDALVAECLSSGNWEAFGVLAQRYREQITRIAGRMLNDGHDVEDVVQDTFVDAIRCLRQYRPCGHFSHWLIRIAMNNVRDRLDSAWGRHVIRWSELDDDDESTPPCKIEHLTTTEPHDPLLKDATERLQGAMLQKSIEELTEKQRLVLTLYFYEDLGTPEIATILRMKEVAVRKHISRACRRLRDNLGPIFDWGEK